MNKYLALTKPGIVMGNAITAAGGFAFASHGSFHFLLFISMLLGISLIVASSCILNNAIDRFADQKMARTARRPLAQGTIPLVSALSLATLFALLGLLLLFLFTNSLATLLAVFGMFVYVALYTPLKYKTPLATPIGSIAGAIPPLVGYTALSHELDLGALLIFLILSLWQMPHFYAIALYRMEEYAAASVAVLPLKKGVDATKRSMIAYTIAFALVSLLPPFFGYAGFVYGVIALLLGGSWVALSLKGQKGENDRKWARQMFLASLVVVTGLCSAIGLKV